METNTLHGNPEEIIIKINLADIFHGKCKSHAGKEHDPGTVVYYIFQVDKKNFELKQRFWTTEELLALVGLTTATHRLFEISHGQKELLLGHKVDLKECGAERFKSVAKHANEGREAAPAASSLRRHITLSPEDAEFLNRYHPTWEVILDGGSTWVLIYGFAVPAGYNVSTATVAFSIPSSYPTQELDMMYFSPALSREDSHPIRALSSQGIDGQNFQRWSRHRNPGDWRLGTDNFETHILSVQGWLQDELKK